MCHRHQRVGIRKARVRRLRFDILAGPFEEAAIGIEHARARARRERFAISAIGLLVASGIFGKQGGREIGETLRALRSAYPGRRLWAVLEPRSNTLRRNVFEKELIDSLSLADHIILAAVFHSEKIPSAERLHPENVVSALQKAGRSAALHENADAIVTNLVPQLASGDVVAILSNGGFEGIYQKLPAALEARTART